MPCNIESLIKNSPIPPLPDFSNKQHNNKQKSVQKTDILFELKEEEKKFYSEQFYPNKDTFSEFFMTIERARAFFVENKKFKNLDEVLILINPKRKGYLSLYEFIVTFHLLVKSKDNKLPKILPEKLKKLVDETNNLSFSSLNNNNINNSNASSNNFNNIKINPSSNNPTYFKDPFIGIPSNNTIILSGDKIPENIKDLNSKISIEKKYNENLKRNEELNRKQNEINKVLKDLEEEINKLKNEKINIQKELNRIKKENDYLFEQIKAYKFLPSAPYMEKKDNKLNMNLNNNPIQNNSMGSSLVNSNVSNLFLKIKQNEENDKLKSMNNQQYEQKPLIANALNSFSTSNSSSQNSFVNPLFLNSSNRSLNFLNPNNQYIGNSQKIYY